MGILNRLKKTGIRGMYPILVFLAVFIVTVNIRWRTLYDFCFKFADNDQYVLWDAAYDMHHGIFHEPCFYGQAYNPLFEPLFAQPFIWLGMPLQFALPLTSGLLGFLPYFVLGWAFFSKKKYISAVFAFAFLMWMPVQFHVITSIPRGYIAACAFAAIGTYLGLFTENKVRFFWFSFLSLTALVTSQNAVFLILPAGMYLFLNHFQNKRFYWQSLLGFVAALPLPLFIYWFYNAHPSYDMHSLEFGFGFDTFIDNLQHTDKIFNYLTPSDSYKLVGVLSFYVLFAAVCFIKRNVKAGISIVSGMLLLLFTLAFDKSQDASSSVFYSGVRMFLGVPVSFIIFCYWAEVSFIGSSVYKKMEIVILTLLLAVAIISSLERNRLFRASLYDNTRKDDTLIDEWVDDTKMFSDRIAGLCRKNHSDLVVFDNWMVEVSYYCPAMNYPFTTMVPSYERRTWIMQKEDKTFRTNFIYLAPDSAIMLKYVPANIHYKKICEDPAAYLVQTDGRKVFDVLKDMKVEVRTHDDELKKKEAL
jgi:hypothetical protein